MASSENNDANTKRRTFLKMGGAFSAILGGAGLGLFGYAAGRDPRSHTGCANFEGAHQSFDREAWAVDRPHYRKTGETSRPDARIDVIFYRRPNLMRQLKQKGAVENFDEPYRTFYAENPEILALDRRFYEEVLPKQRDDNKEYGGKYFLAKAWSNAMGAVSPDPVRAPPEESDFPGKNTKKVKLKDPALTTKLIKKIAHELGSTLVGVARLNHDWVYNYPMRGRGFAQDKPVDVPEHWQFAVVVGTPMSWDPLYANPNYGTSNDAYSRSRIVAFRLAAFIKQLGFAARPHTPGTSYDLMVPPILVDAGIGEQGRHSVVITPELGSNFRPAVVTTDIPLVPDKPIDFGVQDFCRKCKICADNCPSGAISKGDKVEVRGYTYTGPLKRQDT